jgi:hypothetical protein
MTVGLGKEIALCTGILEEYVQTSEGPEKTILTYNLPAYRLHLCRALSIFPNKT